VTIYVKDTRTGYQKVLIDAAAAVAAHEAAPDPHPQYAVDGHTHAQLHDAVTVSDTDTLDLTLTGQAVSGAVKKQMSIDSDTSGLKLVNDSTSPGNNKVYGTDASGVKGWKADPAGAGGGSLDDLTDVTITTPSNGQVLKYNGSTWVNGTDSTGGGGGLSIGLALMLRTPSSTFF
jgi:hypothetical protein